MKLILDIKTTGLPDCTGLEYPNYKLIEKYNNCRLIEIYMIFTDEYFNEIEKYDRTIVERRHFQYDITINDLAQIIRKEFYTAFPRLTIFAHNPEFVMSVIKSEFYRAKQYKLSRIFEHADVVYSMKRLIPYWKFVKDSGNNKEGSKGNVVPFFKYRTLSELYFHVFNTPLVNSIACKSSRNLFNLLIILYNELCPTDELGISV